MPRLGSNGASPARRRRTYNVRWIKATWPYTVQEIADLLDVHKNAVLRWVKSGLAADRSRRPLLIRGNALAQFLRERQSAKRRRCKPNEFYCFCCRVPRAAYLDIVDIVIENSPLLRLRGLCSVCDTPVNKLQRVTDLAKIRESFNVQQLAGEHLIERAGPDLNRDFEG